MSDTPTPRTNGPSSSFSDVYRVQTERIEALERELVDMTDNRDVITGQLQESRRQLASVTAERDRLRDARETEITQFAGYMSGALPELTGVEASRILRVVEQWIIREERERAALAKEPHE